MDTKTKVENEEITIDLYEILLLFRQKIVFILIALVVGAAAAGLVTKFLITPKPPRCTSSRRTNPFWT